MEVIGIISSVSAPRTILGNQGDSQVVDVVINSGSDSFVVSAFDKMAQKVASDEVKENLCICLVEATAREHNGKTFQSLRLRSCGVLMKSVKTI